MQAKTELEAVNTELQTRFTEIEAIHDELREQASRDPLTGLLNRRNLLPTLNQMIEKSAINKQHMIVAMLDLDRFKQFNDKHGHVAGDHMLAAAGHLLREFFRDEDRAFRYGGDEFCIFLPRTNRWSARRASRRSPMACRSCCRRRPTARRRASRCRSASPAFPDDTMQATSSSRWPTPRCTREAQAQGSARRQR